MPQATPGPPWKRAWCPARLRLVGFLPSLRGGLPPLPATVAGIAIVRQGAIGSKAGRPPGCPALSLLDRGYPMRHRLVGATPFPALGLPPSRPARHRQAGSSSRGPGRGANAPPSRRSVSGGRRRLPTFTWSSLLRDSPGSLPRLPARGSNPTIARQPPRPLSFRCVDRGTRGPTRRSPGVSPDSAWPSGALTVGLHARIHCPAPPAAAARSGMHLGP